MQNGFVDEIWKQIEVTLKSEPTGDVLRRLGKTLESAGFKSQFEADIFLEWPYSVLMTEYEAILDWVDYKWQGRPLRILDLATGSGMFTQMARERRHDCVATHDGANIFGNPDEADALDVSNPIELKMVLRDLLRYKFGIQTEHFWIHRDVEKSRFEPSLAEKKFDFIYAGQSTFHWPSNHPLVQSADYWTADIWYRFIKFMRSRFLKDDGTILVTVAYNDDPRSVLGPELKPYLTDSFSLTGPVEGSRNWQALLVGPDL